MCISLPLLFSIQATCAPGRVQLTWPRVATVTATWDVPSGAALTLTRTPLLVSPWPACVSAAVLAALVDRMVPWATLAAAYATFFFFFQNKNKFEELRHLVFF